MRIFFLLALVLVCMLPSGCAQRMHHPRATIATSPPPGGSTPPRAGSIAARQQHEPAVPSTDKRETADDTDEPSSPKTNDQEDSFHTTVRFQSPAWGDDGSPINAYTAGNDDRLRTGMPVSGGTRTQGARPAQPSGPANVYSANTIPRAYQAAPANSNPYSSPSFPRQGNPYSSTVPANSYPYSTNASPATSTNAYPGTTNSGSGPHDQSSTNTPNRYAPQTVAQAPTTVQPAYPPLPPPGTARQIAPNNPPFQPGGIIEPLPDGATADIDVVVQETQTGRFMFGVGVNSDLGVTAQIVIDERNFHITRAPTGFHDFVNGTAFRGAGQGFRLEAMPGTQVNRYLVSFSEPYLFGFMPISFNLSGFYYDRRFLDWDEQRLGGRAALGYRLNHDLSLSGALRAENVNISNPRVSGVSELDSAIGDNSLYSGRVALTHDTRDMPFAATEGHLLELSFEQVFGTYDYPRGELDYRRYFLVRERPDGSGRHTLAYSFRVGVSGAQTPIFENFFAGGYSTMRGFRFRGASPVNGGVQVGGEFRFLGSVEYIFPLTADDMMKGVVFCDYGTTEEKVQFQADTYRVAPGFGLRVAIPAMGPAPLALDFAFPVASADTDDKQVFSFFIGFGR